jgi:hypothetical protein
MEFSQMEEKTIRRKHKKMETLEGATSARLAQERIRPNRVATIQIIRGDYLI